MIIKAAFHTLPLDSRVRGNHHGLAKGHIREMKMAEPSPSPLWIPAFAGMTFWPMSSIFIAMTGGQRLPTPYRGMGQALRSGTPQPGVEEVSHGVA